MTWIVIIGDVPRGGYRRLAPMRKIKGRFIITGSSSPSIIKRITESLAGRIATVEMAPFKQCEYYEKGLSDFYSILSGVGDINALMQLQPAHSLA